MPVWPTDCALIDVYKRQVEDMRGGKLLLFTSPWNIDWATDHNKELKLSEFGNVEF